MPAPADPAFLDIGVRIGGAVRLGDASALTVSDRSAYVISAGLLLTPTPRFGVGLSYEHGSLGAEHAAGDLGSIDVSRGLDAGWLGLRLNFFRTENFALALTVSPGLVWQNARSSAIVLGGAEARPSTFDCREGGSAGLGLRAGLGTELRTGDHVVLTADAVADNLRLGSDYLGTCAPGAGSVTMIGLRFGFAFRVDVSRVVR